MRSEIDLVIVDHILSRRLSLPALRNKRLLRKIDIGGISLIRAAEELQGCGNRSFQGSAQYQPLMDLFEREGR